VSFRAKIFFSILLPACILVSIATVAALAEIQRESEREALESLERAKGAFLRVLEEQSQQLKSLSIPFEGTRFDAAITESVNSGELDVLKETVRDEMFHLFLDDTPEFYEVVGKLNGKILLLGGARPPRSITERMQRWVGKQDRDRVLTEYGGDPYLAIRVTHDKGYFIFGKNLVPYLNRLSEAFEMGVVMVQDSRTIYASVAGGLAAHETEGAVALDGVRYRVSAGTPPHSELDRVTFFRSMKKVDDYKAKVMGAGAFGLALAVLVAGLVSLRVSRDISRPVETLVQATRAVGAGDYGVTVEIPGRDEMAHLGGAFNEMTQGLRKRREIMEKTLSRDVAEELMKGLELGGERREVTILFMDVRGFTGATEGVDPAQVVTMLNDMMNVLAGAVARHGGNVNKYLGDGLMAMFGAPRDLADHAFLAVQARLDMRGEIASWNRHRALQGEDRMEIGIGINTGTVVGGKVGSRSRLEYTLIGEEVNLASRICGKAAPGQVLITKQTYLRVGGRFRTNALEPVQVKGLSYPVEIFEVLS
jgi:class 3 adenylate cyclase